ncbi:MAG: hypothetical protein LBI79_10255 [Nitrososphaerota archaeon]|nr:hypothetical protein [Nitrososphaerota archaeon]
MMIVKKTNKQGPQYKYKSNVAFHLFANHNQKHHQLPTTTTPNTNQKPQPTPNPPNLQNTYTQRPKTINQKLHKPTQKTQTTTPKPDSDTYTSTD